jgi:uncharacterized repeat protein (TIGR03806 family)
MRLLRIVLRVLLACVLVSAPAAFAAAPRAASVPYLNMPRDPQQPFPALLSATGAFANVRTLQPARSLLPYELNAPFWSDGAQKLRLMALPPGNIGFASNDPWTFPPGTVFVKTFVLGTDAANPQNVRRLETRLLMVGDAGSVYGATYRWRPDNSDADLLVDAVTESIPVKGGDGVTRSQDWYFPSRQDCLTCHTHGAGGVLGVNTRQLNRGIKQTGNGEHDALREWNRAGLLKPRIAERDFATLPRLAAVNDPTRSVEDRARSYLDANCAQCHRPGGTVAGFDARYATPLDAQSLVAGKVLIDHGVDRARIIAPHDPWRSMALLRMNTTGDIRMPPLARQTIDAGGVEVIRRWILSLEGPDVAAPPRMSPAGGAFNGAVRVELAAEPGAEIRFTVDGSAPGPSDARYEGPVQLTNSTTLRARAYRPDTTRSVIVQETYQVASGTTQDH